MSPDPKGPQAAGWRQRKFDLLRRFPIPLDLLPGSLTVSRTRCGKPSCHCAEGQGHEAWTLTFMSHGKRRVERIPKDWVDDQLQRLDRSGLPALGSFEAHEYPKPLPSGAFGCVLSRLMIIYGEFKPEELRGSAKQQEIQRGNIMSGSTKQICLLAVVTCLVFTGVASASPLGTANISNCTPNGGVTVSATTITWLPAAGANLGCIATDPPTSISFSGGTFTSGTGTISDLPAGSTNPWVVLGGVLDFSLSAFVAPAPTDGVCSTSVALALGHSCITAIGSPFLLISQGATTAVSLIANGVVTDTGDASTSNYQGIFTTQLTVTTAQIAATLDGGGSVNTPYSATLSVEAPTGTPEPGTISMFLLGGVALAGLGRRRFGKH